jgi:hypothetical protein
MADPTGFPIWLDGPGGPTLVNDLASYRAAVKQGWAFNPANPPVTHPAPGVVVVQTEVSRAQRGHENPTKVK